LGVGRGARGVGACVAGVGDAVGGRELLLEVQTQRLRGARGEHGVVREP
jgi:hypothetical protein